MDSIGGILKIFRKKNKYSQQYLADYLGIVRQTYSHYETGRIVPTYEALAKLAILYQVSPEILMGVAGIEHDREEKVISFSADEWLLVQYFREMDTRDREETMEIVKRKAERNVDRSGTEKA